ncbi:MAG: PAS domain-containing sensor histidine kinase [Rhodothermales bacterium]
MQEAGRTKADFIQDQKRAGVVGREPRSLLYKIFHASPAPISISRLSDGTLVDVNEEWSLFTGYSPSEAVGRSSTDLGLWSDAGVFATLQAIVNSENSAHEKELGVKTKDGRQKTVLWSAQRIDVEGEPCILTVMSDITERNRSISALQESERRFRVVADSAPVLIWMSDENIRRTYVNKPWIEFTGLPLEEHLGRGWMASIFADDLETFLKKYEESHRKREPFAVEYRLRRHDGEYRWMLDKGVPRSRADGSFAGYVGSCVDINEQKETQKKLLEAKEYAEETAKLKSTFLTNMTHEIRTPLTVILGFTSILRQGVRVEYQRFVNLIERSGRRLLLMLDSMLDLAQLEAGSLEIDQQKYNVGEIVEGVVAMLAPIIEEKGLTLNLSLPAERCYARVDHAVLTRVLNNMLDNAVKFTDEGEINIALEKRGPDIHITLQDTGIGIEQRFLAHVFDPFVQESSGLDRTHQGSGLGLAVSKRLLELMGGTVRVESSKGEGSVFTIILPAAR